MQTFAICAVVAWTWYSMTNHPSGASEQEDIEVPTYAVSDLLPYDGTGQDPTILIGVWGRVFNVTEGGEFYNQGKGYSVFAGHDCTYAFAITSTKAKHVDLPISSLTERNLENLNATYWETYVAKYPIIGRLSDPPYDPSEYDRYAGPFATMLPTGWDSPRPARRGRQSRCPAKRAAKIIKNTILNLIPQQLAPPSWVSDDGAGAEASAEL